MNWKTKNLIFSICTNLNFNHCGRQLEKIENHDCIIGTTSDIMVDHKINQCLQDFINIAQLGNCFLLDSWKHLKNKFQPIHKEHDSVKHYKINGIRGTRAT